jgi:amino acid adenylation domain-containing protein
MHDAMTTDLEPPTSLRIDDLIERQVRLRPQALALEDGERQLTYAELWARAGGLARELRARGVRDGAPVALQMERSLALVVAVVGVLRAGGACVPLDPADPPARLAAVLEHADTAAVVTTAALAERLGGARDVVVLEDCAPQAEVDVDGAGSPDDLAFVFFTSGSTGAPKGTMHTHRSCTAQLEWVRERVGLRSEDRHLLKTSVGFVSLLRQFIWPLATGARIVVVAAGREHDVDHLGEVVDRHGVTFMSFITPGLAAFLRRARLDGASVRCAITGGDAFPPGLQEDFFAAFPQAELHQSFGCTEVPLVTWWQFRPGRPDETPLGLPIPGVTAHVLDEDMRPVAPGDPGELYVHGEGVSAGYFGLPALTAERYLDNPFAPGTPLLRTTDRVRQRQDGVFELVGRTQRMVKIRGFRIEPAEIELTLSTHDAVAEAAVVVEERDGGDKRLVAFVAPRARREISPGEAMAFLESRLPRYMLPSAIVPLDELPLTGNAKVDRRRLADLTTPPATAAGAAMPSSDLERTIAEVWSDALEVDREAVGADVDFFALGGDSLAAAEISARLEEALDREVPYLLLFEASTVASLARALEGSPA